MSIEKPSCTLAQKATGIALAIALPGLSMAAQSTLPTIEMAATGSNRYNATKVQSAKFTQPLLETPKTVTVLTRENLKDQNLLSLTDALSTTPGITFGAGEGGGGFGDKINIRGFDSTYDITIDNLRDSALTSRTDTFNVEAIEVAKGSGSSISGMGAVGGNINLQSKTPKQRNSNELTLGVGTDHYSRLTGDFNRKLGKSTAARLNVMLHQNDIPGRTVEDKQRWGIAPSIRFGMGTPTRLTLSYMHQQDNNVPQYGVPFYNGKPVSAISPANYYGYHNLDDQDIVTDYFTASIEADLTHNLTLNSTSRVGRVRQDTIVSAPQGVFCLANNTKPVAKSDANPDGYAPCDAKAGELPGRYLVSGPRGYRRDTANKLITSDTNVVWHVNTGAIAHTLVAGINVIRESYDLTTSGYLYNADGSAAIRPSMDVYHPDHWYNGPINHFVTGITRGEQDTKAAYLIDTLKLHPQLDINLGIRYDHVSGSTQTDNYTEVVKVNGKDTTYARPYLPRPTALSPSSGVGPVFSNQDNLLSYQGAITFKPTGQSSVYASYANAKTPSKASVNGACTAATCEVDPENARTYEIGTKWQSQHHQLLLTSALFRTDRTNYKVADPANPANPAGFQVLDGSSRVQGIELGASGKITPQWNIYTALAYLDSEVLQGTSNRQAALGIDYTKGDHLTGIPQYSGSLWSTYDINRQWQLGYGFTYQGKTYVSQHSASAIKLPQQTADDYWIHNLAATYHFSRHMQMQLNVKNIFDKEYYTAGRNNGWAIPGDGVNGVLTLSYRF